MFGIHTYKPLCFPKWLRKDRAIEIFIGRFHSFNSTVMFKVYALTSNAKRRSCYEYVRLRISITNCPLVLAIANRQLPSSIGNCQRKSTLLGSRSCIRILHTAKISISNHQLPTLAIGKFPAYQPLFICVCIDQGTFVVCQSFPLLPTYQ